MKRIRGRFAPSPTGEMHLGNAWTALLSWLYIKSQGGEMVLRVEDLDPDRSRCEYTALLLDDMKWLGLDWDEGPACGGPYDPYCQRGRSELYDRALQRLREGGHLYHCYCTRAELHTVTVAPHTGEREFVYSGICRTLSKEAQEIRSRTRRPALRLAVPEQTIRFRDGLQGEMAQSLRTACGDFVVRRADGVHAYQLAVVVDDGLMNISHVIRGADLLASTPRQLLLYELLQLEPPAFFHVPLLYGNDGHRLSKRHGSFSLVSMRKRGLTPEEIIGYLAWKAGQIERWEPVRPQELLRQFRIAAIPSGPIVVDDAVLLG